MKRRVAAKVLAIGLAAGTVFAGAAQAQGLFNGLYTDIGYSGAYPDFKKHSAAIHTPSYMDGVEADVGWRFNRYYSVEASYSYFTGSANPKGGSSFNNTLQDGSIDALGFLPLGPWRDWALYADVGGTWYFSSSSGLGGHANKFGGRAGGGLQYQFDENLGLRVGGRYNWANLPNMKTAATFTVGLIWQR